MGDWYIPKECRNKFKMVKREKIPQEFIDLMNGKQVKFKVNVADWKRIKVSKNP